jgi:hypothetical protein
VSEDMKFNWHAVKASGIFEGAVNGAVVVSIRLHTTPLGAVRFMNSYLRDGKEVAWEGTFQSLESAKNAATAYMLEQKL